MRRENGGTDRSSILSFITSALVVVVLAQTVVAEETKAGTDKQPNILFIFSDDHATHAIGAYNGLYKGVDPTPHIDQLAREGMLFENSFCTNSICGPSRAVILTGKHSHKNGFMNNGNRFDANQTTFPKLLQQCGYQTALFGKWHLKSSPQGFDIWMVLPGQGAYYNPEFLTPSGGGVIRGHCTQIVTDLAVKWLKDGRDPDKPFLLMCQHKAPHRNWMPDFKHISLYDDTTLPEPDTLFDKWEDNAPPARHQEMEIDRHMDLHYDLFVDLTAEFDGDAIGERQDRSARDNLWRMSPEQKKRWRDAYEADDAAFHAAKLSGKDLVRWKYQRYAKNYLRCVRGVDDSVGELMATLKELGLEENTIVVYSSDQGFYIGDHGWYDKRWMYEESLKMPLIIKWPGMTKPGSRNTMMVQNIDYAETFLEAAACDADPEMQGESLVPLLAGETPQDWRKKIYYHYYEFPSVHMVPRHYGIRTERYKLMHFYQFDEWEFYDLEADPDELVNLYEDPAYAEKIDAMKQELIALREQVEDDSDVSLAPDEFRSRFRKGQSL
ncbi:MAG: sulfatase [Planctomycetales bacterium]